MENDMDRQQNTYENVKQLKGIINQKVNGVQHKIEKEIEET